MVDENVKGKADIKLSVKAVPLAGVTIPKFTIRSVDEEKCKKKIKINLNIKNSR